MWMPRVGLAARSVGQAVRMLALSECIDQGMGEARLAMVDTRGWGGFGVSGFLGLGP